MRSWSLGVTDFQLKNSATKLQPSVRSAVLKPVYPFASPSVHPSLFCVSVCLSVCLSVSPIDLSFPSVA